MPCWIEDQQAICFIDDTAVSTFHHPSNPLFPSAFPLTSSPSSITVRIIFPLTCDHLITLLQYNVLRACLANRLLLTALGQPDSGQCSSMAQHVLPYPPSHDSIPSSLYPTTMQQSVPHEEWIDAIPHPTWRDNLILAAGTYDEDQLWSDTIGGLFEGFPQSEIKKRGVIAWSPPWHYDGWELSEGFWRTWGWTMHGCDDILQATNKWRQKRGEPPLV